MLIPQTYAGGTLDRAEQLRRDEAALVATLEDPRARFLLLDNLMPLMTADGADIAWQKREDILESTAVLLGLDSAGIPHFAAEGTAGGRTGILVDLRQTGMALGADPKCALLAHARALIDWHRRNRFCAACGAPSQPVRGGAVRQCPACEAEHYPRVDPVVIMLAVKDDMALIARQASFPRQMWSALAGFIEPAESLEEAVARELFEEARVRVGKVRYLGSQPWPFPSNLMLGAIAEARDFTLDIDGHEIAEARWVSRANCIAALKGEADWFPPQPFAIAHALLRHWSCID
ncbi:MAG: NAD(+) diphosphatase [Sphingomonadaceae bacterium]